MNQNKMARKKAPHPIFGDFEAHKGNCRPSLDFGIHCNQAEHVARTTKSESEEGEATWQRMIMT
jgi:hypothetical protein